jgi:hypothetical protein
MKYSWIFHQKNSKNLLHKVLFFWEKVVFEIFNISTNEFRTRIVEYDEVADD